MKNKNSEYYIDPAELKTELQKSKKLGRATERLGAMILTVGKKVLNFNQFKGYHQDLKDELLMFGIERFLKCGIRTVTIDKNPFAYITQSFYINYLNFLKKYYRQKNQENKYKLDMIKRSEMINPNLKALRKKQQYLNDELDF